jgi:hypothetical protein
MARASESLKFTYAAWVATSTSIDTEVMMLINRIHIPEARIQLRSVDVQVFACRPTVLPNLGHQTQTPNTEHL